MSRFLTKKVSAARRWNPKRAINVRSSSPRKLYSTFADQLGAKAHSMPAPTSQPLLVLLLETAVDAPVVRLVTVKSSLPTQPPPATGPARSDRSQRGLGWVAADDRIGGGFPSADK